MPRTKPRTPEFDGTETQPAWGDVSKTLASYVEHYTDRDPDDVDGWEDLSQNDRQAIAARSLNGTASADDFDGGVVLPVVNPSTDNLSRPGLQSAAAYVGRTDGIDQDATASKIDALLEEHFGSDESSNPHMSTTPDSGDESQTDHFEKRVEVLAKDEDEQVATAAALVPDRLDHQGDFLRADTIADLADGYGDRFENGEVYPGVMHSVFPDDGVDLVESRVLDDAETIGEKDLPAGSWVQRYKFTDDELWSLVDDGVLGGVSIGGTAKGVLYEPGAMPDDVEIPDAVAERLEEAGLDRDDIMVREITDGRILETSQVDHPAVPDAVHAEAKALAKASPALTDNIVTARLYLEARGHDANDARRLAEYLQENKSRKGFVDRAKSFFGFGGAGGGEVRASGADEQGEQASDERAESRTGSGSSDTNTMTEDDINEKLEALETRLDGIDEKLSEAADGDDPEDGDEKNDDGDEPSVDEKVDRLAEATMKISEQVEQMANAQGVSQQADQGAGTNSEKDIWGDESPFRGGL